LKYVVTKGAWMSMNVPMTCGTECVN